MGKITPELIAERANRVAETFYRVGTILRKRDDMRLTPLVDTHVAAQCAALSKELASIKNEEADARLTHILTQFKTYIESIGQIQARGPMQDDLDSLKTLLSSLRNALDSVQALAYTLAEKGDARKDSYAATKSLQNAILGAERLLSKRVSLLSDYLRR